MKKIYALLHLISCTLLFVSLSLSKSSAQNVGINNTSPTEKLTINGNLLVTQPVTKSKGLPDAAHTSSLTSHQTNAYLVITDSVYRVYDPGGTANYPAADTSAVQLIDTTGASSGEVAGGFEISFDSINIAPGDSLYLISQVSDILLRGGSNLNGTHPSFSGNNLIIYLVVAPGSPTAPGFSAIIRKLYVNKNAAGAGGTAGNGNVSLFFNSLTGSFKAGIGNANELGNGAFAIGSNCRASGSNAGAVGASSSATGTADVAIAGGQASGGNSVAIGYQTYTLGNSSVAIGPGSRSDGQNAITMLGGYAIAYNSMAVGPHSRTDGNNSIALNGGYTSPNGYNAAALGYDAHAQKDYAIAIGKEAYSSGIASIAAGVQSGAIGENSAAIGYKAQATGYGSVALGSSASVGYISTSSGTSTAYGTYSTAMGENCSASGQASFAAGTQCYTGSAGKGVAIGFHAGSSAANAIAIGNYVTADGTFSTAMGNYCTTSGHTGCLTIGDNSTTTIMTTGEDNAMRARFAKGFRFYTTSAVTIGAFLNQGANSWAALSDRRMKENFLPVDGESFLHKIAAMPLTTWNYIGQDVKEYRHYGPMAQDFFAAFGKDNLGAIGCDTLINQQDFLGVNLIAIQALEKRTDEVKSQNSEVKSEIDELRMENEKLKSQNEKQEAAIEELRAQMKELQRTLQPKTAQK